MTTLQRDPAVDMLDLTAKLTADGWDRLRGARLLHAATAALDVARQTDWQEGIGRAEALILVLGEFVRESPAADRLKAVLHSTHEFARLLQEGHLTRLVDPGNLPVDPDDWQLLVLGNQFTPDPGLLRTIRQLGIKVEHESSIESLATLAPGERCILLAGAAWLAGQAGRLDTVAARHTAAGFVPPVLVAVTEGDDFRTQVLARQAGARLLLDAPLDAARLGERVGRSGLDATQPLPRADGR